MVKGKGMGEMGTYIFNRAGAVETPRRRRLRKGGRGQEEG